MKIIFATTSSIPHNNILQDEKVKHRLYSYWELYDKPQAFLDHYIQTGRLPSKSKKGEQEAKPKRRRLNAKATT